MMFQSSCPSRDALSVAVILDRFGDWSPIFPVRVPAIETGNGVTVGITVEGEKNVKHDSV